jgi:hypothetical protein
MASILLLVDMAYNIVFLLLDQTKNIIFLSLEPFLGICCFFQPFLNNH